MDASDKADTEVKKRGRPKKDYTTPIGEYRIEQSKLAQENKSKNTIVEKYYELRGTKLSLVKRKESGTINRTYIGDTTDKKRQLEMSSFVKKLQAEGRLKIKV